MSDDGQVIRKAFLEALSRLEHHDGISATDTLDALDRLESQNQALQERAEKAEAYLLVIADGVWNEPRIRKVEGRDLNISVEQFARNALSPTQETEG